jgi:hypothetical protein
MRARTPRRPFPSFPFLAWSPKGPRTYRASILVYSHIVMAEILDGPCEVVEMLVPVEGRVERLPAWVRAKEGEA